MIIVEEVVPKRTQAPTLTEVRKWSATISVAQAAAALGVSKSHLYALIAAGESPLDTIPLGANRQRIITASLLRILEPRSKETAA